MQVAHNYCMLLGNRLPTSVENLLPVSHCADLRVGVGNAACQLAVLISGMRFIKSRHLFWYMAKLLVSSSF